MSLDHGAGFVKSQTTTRDAFLGGRITITQPKSGFRAGLDTILLGASVAADSRTLLDLGSGVGTAALTALTHNIRLEALLAEKNPQMLALARENILHNNLGERALAVELDVTAAGDVRSAAGLKTDYFSTVIANPPFFDAAGGTKAPETGRADARHMHEDALDKWVRTAAASAAPRGEVIFIYRADGLTELLKAFSARFGAITVLPIVPRSDGDANRILLRGIKGSRAPLVLKSPLVLHGAEGHGFVADIDAIFRGNGVLHW